MDLFKVTRFVLNGGRWNGKQILNEEYIKAATAKQTDNNYFNMNTWNTQGYGYLFLRTYQNSFFSMAWAVSMRSVYRIRI